MLKFAWHNDYIFEFLSKYNERVSKNVQNNLSSKNTNELFPK